MGKILENNNVKVSGMVEENFQYSHKVYGEKFYTTHILSQRTSGTLDRVPIMVSERMVDVSANWKDQYVEVQGCFRSHSEHKDGRNRLILFVFVSDLVSPENVYAFDRNHIELEGYLCKKPNYRVTPLKREITDLFIAVNRDYGKSDYIPCITWGRNAIYADELSVGQKIRLRGRIQSRVFQKKLEDETFEERTAYEVSCSSIEEVKEEVEETA